MTIETTAEPRRLSRSRLLLVAAPLALSFAGFTAHAALSTPTGVT